MQIRPLAAAVLTLALGACSSPRERTLDSLIADAREENAILEPSLRSAVESRLEAATARGRAYEGKPSILCRGGGSSGAGYRSPDGSENRKFTTLSYEVQAVETIHRYKIAAIVSIQRTGRADDPYAASVNIAVEVQERKSTTFRHDLKPAIPAGWVPNGDVEELAIVRGGYVRSNALGPLDGPPEPETLKSEFQFQFREDPPRELEPLAARASDDCLKAKPSSRVDIVTLTFRLSADRKTWR